MNLLATIQHVFTSYSFSFVIYYSHILSVFCPSFLLRQQFALILQFCNISMHNLFDCIAAVVHF